MTLPPAATKSPSTPLGERTCPPAAYTLRAVAAAVVLGGTSILGGRGSYLGTVAGVILITLLQSILSVMQMPEAGRQIIYGVVIVAMLLLYGRAPASR